jgi:hypothetical protein
VALFDRRLGQATPEDVSGTAHEIKRSTEAGKPVHTWFSEEPIERHNIDPKELARLAKYRKELEGQGLLGVYANPNDLAYKVRTAIEHDIDKMGLGSAQVKRPKTEHAMPRLSRAGNVLYVRNYSTDVTAEQFTIDVHENTYVWVHKDDDEPFDLLPLADYEWPLMVAAGGDKLVVTMRWLEDGEPQEQTQTVAV